MHQLAEKANTTASTINKLEKGQMRLTEDWIYRLATALEIEPEQLLAAAAAAGQPVASGFQENAEPFIPPPDHALRSTEHVGYFKMQTDDLLDHPAQISSESVLAFDLNVVDLAKVEPGKICYFSLMDRTTDTFAGRLIGVFMPPNKVMSNRPRDNWVVNIEDPDWPYEATLRGVLRFVVREFSA